MSAKKENDFTKWELLAGQTYIDRRTRRQHPDGEFDAGGRWHPSSEEEQGCCTGIRFPSRKWPYSYMLHCRTAEHMASLHDVERARVLAAARWLET